MAFIISLPSTMSPLGIGVYSIGSLPAASPLLSDFIDPATNDFRSLFVSLDPIDLQVINALKIVRGSGPVVIEDGNNLESIKKITNTIRRDIESEIKIALARLIRNGDIRYKGISEVKIQPENQYVEWMVSWYNLRSTHKGNVRSASLIFNPGV